MYIHKYIHTCIYIHMHAYNDYKRIIMSVFAVHQIRGLSYEQMEVFLTSRAFIFPQMLPEYRMESMEEGEKKCRVMFSESEDK